MVFKKTRAEEEGGSDLQHFISSCKNNVYLCRFCLMPTAWKKCRIITFVVDIAPVVSMFTETSKIWIYCVVIFRLVQRIFLFCNIQPDNHWCPYCQKYERKFWSKAFFKIQLWRLNEMAHLLKKYYWNDGALIRDKIP